MAFNTLKPVLWVCIATVFCRLLMNSHNYDLIHKLQGNKVLARSNAILEEFVDIKRDRIDLSLRELVTKEQYEKRRNPPISLSQTYVF